MSWFLNIFEKLFANDYFGIILFGVIALLVLLFIITLFFGLTDTKEKDEIKKKEKETEKDLFYKIDDTVKLDIPKDESTFKSTDDESIKLPKIKENEDDEE